MSVKNKQAVGLFFLGHIAMSCTFTILWGNTEYFRTVGHKLHTCTYSGECCPMNWEFSSSKYGWTV